MLREGGKEAGNAFFSKNLADACCEDLAHSVHVELKLSNKVHRLIIDHQDNGTLVHLIFISV